MVSSVFGPMKHFVEISNRPQPLALGFARLQGLRSRLASALSSSLSNTRCRGMDPVPARTTRWQAVFQLGAPPYRGKPNRLSVLRIGRVRRWPIAREWIGFVPRIVTWRQTIKALNYKLPLPESHVFQPRYFIDGKPPEIQRLSPRRRCSRNLHGIGQANRVLPRVEIFALLLGRHILNDLERLLAVR